MSIRGNALAGNKRARGTVTTTNGTAAAVVVPGGSVAGVLALPNNKTWLVSARVAARRTDTGTESAGYVASCLVRRGVNAAATAIVGAPAVTAYEDTSAWDIAFAADTTNGGLKLNVTGEAAKTIKWVAQFTVVEA